MASHLQAELAALKHGSHVCLVYENRNEQVRAVVPFIRAGLARGECCVYIVDEHTATELRAVLTADGVDVAHETARGALLIETKRETYLKGGAFDPPRMIAFLRETERLALAAGFTGLRVTGEMTWALGADTDPTQVVAYEALLNEFFPGSASLAICQYNRARFAPEMLEDVLRTHPIAVLGDQVCPNLYYEPPAMVLGQVSKAEKVDWMIGQLRRAQAAEEAVRASEAKLRRVAESGIVGLFYWDLAGGVTDANDAFLGMLGYTRADLAMGRLDWRTLTPPEYAEADAPHLAELLAEGRHAPYETAYRAADGRHVPVLIASACFDGARDRGVCVCVDVSEQARTREAAEAARQVAEAASRAKSEFLATMSHELRTPLNAIMGYEQLLAEGLTGPVTDAQRRQLGRIRASADHLLGLIDEILTLTRLDAGQDPPRVTPAALSRVLDEAAAVIAPAAMAKGLALRLGTPAPGWVVETDGGKLRQILVNLLSNAVKFTERGEVRLTAGTAPDGGVEIAVADTGIGIAPEAREQIFERFWQAAGGHTRVAGGTGLGLHIVRRLAEQLGASVDVESALGVGSTFTVRLPCRPAPDAPDGPPAATPPG